MNYNPDKFASADKFTSANRKKSANSEVDMASFLSSVLTFASSKDTDNALDKVTNLLVDTANFIYPPNDKSVNNTMSKGSNTTTAKGNNNTVKEQTVYTFKYVPKIKTLVAQIDELQRQVEGFNGGNEYCKELDTNVETEIYDILEKKYDKLMNFNYDTTYEKIVQGVMPNAKLPYYAKTQLCEYISKSRNIELRQYDSPFTVTKVIYKDYETEVNKWLNDNVELYILA